MFDWIRENSIAFVVAVVLHFIFFGALFFNWQMDKPKKIVLEQGDVIQVTSVDANTYDAEIKKIEEQKKAKQRLKKQRKAEAERKAQALKKKKQQEQARRQKEKKQKAEELKRKKAAAAKKKKEAKKKAEQEKKSKEAEKKAAEAKRKKAEQKRKEEQKKAEQEKRRLEEEKKEEKKRRAAEQKRKAEEEKKHQAELRRQEERANAERKRLSKGIINRHVAMIAQKIERNWRQPLDAPTNLQCKIDIVLLPSGKVVSVKVVESSGNLSFDRSVETAVRRASPLPVPADSVIFKQFEVMRLRFEPGK